jgi:hypothetical protein
MTATTHCPPTCGRKVGHFSKAEAKAEKRRKMKGKWFEGDLRVYQCPHCGLWYLGRWREFNVEGARG